MNVYINEYIYVYIYIYIYIMLYSAVKFSSVMERHFQLSQDWGSMGDSLVTVLQETVLIGLYTKFNCIA